jgi:hypothetical protein
MDPDLDPDLDPDPAPNPDTPLFVTGFQDVKKQKSFF